MSLVGSLEDLGLADILQIVSLARKSGILALRSEDGDGRILFREGLVHAARVKGQPEDLEGLLRRAGATEAGAADASAPGRIEALRRELVEQALARMLEWRSGEFSFDVCDEPDCGDGLALAAGLSAQYLAMEATRRNDERQAGVAARSDDALLFSGEADPAPDPTDALVEAVLGRSDEQEDGGPTDRAAAERGVARARPSEVVRAACAHVVIVDPDLTALEWLKTALSAGFERLHLFQSAEGGIARIRQYLSRGEVPAVLLSAHAPMDPLSGIDTVADLLRRLRAQAPRMPLLLVAEEGSPPPRSAGLADGVLVRPTPAALIDPRSAERVAAAARAVRSRLAPFARGERG